MASVQKKDVKFLSAYKVSVIPDVLGSNESISRDFSILEKKIPAAFIDLLIYPSRDGMSFNHRKVNANKVESLKFQGADAIFETPVKLVALAHLTVPDGAVAGSFDSVNNCIHDLFRGQRMTQFYDPSTNDPRSRKSARVHEVEFILDKLVALNVQYDITKPAGIRFVYDNLLSSYGFDLPPEAERTYIRLKTDFQQICYLRLDPFDGQHRLQVVQDLLMGVATGTVNKKWLERGTSFSAKVYVPRLVEQGTEVKLDRHLYGLFASVSIACCTDNQQGSPVNSGDLIAQICRQATTHPNLIWSKDNFYAKKTSQYYEGKNQNIVFRKLILLCPFKATIPLVLCCSPL